MRQTHNRCLKSIKTVSTDSFGHFAKSSLLFVVFGGCVALGSLLSANNVLADEPGREEFQERIPLPPSDEVPVPEVEEDEWVLGAHAGVTVFNFADEHSKVGPAVFLDAMHTSVPLNFRFGVEGTHVNLEQARVTSRFSDTPDIDYVRVPFSLEYVHELCPYSTLYVGGGPDIINIRGLASDTGVGGHLGARILQRIGEDYGISLEAGYQWAELDAFGHNVNLDGAYITTLFSAFL